MKKVLPVAFPAQCWANLRIGDKFSIEKRLGNGSFGEIYQGKNIVTGEPVAIKVESRYADEDDIQIEDEYCAFVEIGEGVGIPQCKWFGNEIEYHCLCLVLELLGPNLEDLRRYCGGKFSLKTVLMIADQLLTRIEFIHSKNCIHRDIKPENFCMGIAKRGNRIHAIDFGLAKRFVNYSGEHIPMREGKSLTGTARYVSINNHLGYENSRRDDIESIGYMLIYFLKGSLPWQGLRVLNKDKRYQKILEKKQSTSIETLTHGLPPEFNLLIAYARGLRFDEKPDYAYLRKLFMDLYEAEKFEKNWIFDWNRIFSKDKQEVKVAESNKREADHELEKSVADLKRIETGNEIEKPMGDLKKAEELEKPGDDLKKEDADSELNKSVADSKECEELEESGADMKKRDADNELGESMKETMIN